MKRVLLVITALLSLTVLLAACKKSDDTISTPASTATSSAGPEATPEPTLPPYEANVLTGEAKGENYPEGQRITALMVNNLVDARPQRGLSKAQMLFEIKVEGGITRFMPVFNDYHDIDEIGPIRSGRDQFFQLILPWQALYIHEGQSVVMQQYAIDFSYGNLNNNDGVNDAHYPTFAPDGYLSPEKMEEIVAAIAQYSPDADLILEYMFGDRITEEQMHSDIRRVARIMEENRR
mgnify:CR=1 FL=1